MIGPFQWVLSNARVHAADPDRRSAAGFARRLPGRPHRSQVKRWESGQVGLTHGLVRRYERGLDLPEGQLLRAIDLLAREDAPQARLPALPPPPSDDLVAEAMPLLEQALEYDAMTGLDWDRLTTLIGSARDVIVRKRDWESLIHRLGRETAVSTGLEYTHRWEASARMVGNHRTSDVVIELIESSLTDDDEQLYSDYANLLRFCPDPRGHDLLLEVIASPPNARALWASLSTATTLVHHRLIARAQVDAVLPRVVDVVLDDTLPLRTRRAAASFALRADHPTSSSGPTRLSSRQRRAVDGLLAKTGLSAAVQDDLLRSTRARLVRDTPSDADDPVLTRLLRTALQEPHNDVRDTALAVLLLAPQGVALGHALAGDLATALDAGDLGRASADLGMLSWVPQASDLGLLTDVTLGRRGTPDLMPLAGAALGNVPLPVGPAESALGDDLFAYATERLRTRAADRDAPAGNAWGVTYALGMRGRFDLLDRLLRVATAQGDAPWRSSLQWWVDLPEVIRPVRPTRR